MIRRFVEHSIKRLATQYPVVTITGPRQSGKTTLCKAAFPHFDYANLEDLETRQFAVTDPKGFLAQFQKGVILDEIQRTPDLPSAIQGIVDSKRQNGLFIITGSEQFQVTQSVNQSLAGRTAIVRLLPFAFDELYEVETAPQLNQILYSGFYPRLHDQKLNPTEMHSFYVSTYIERDLRSLLNIKDLSNFEKFLRLCASNIGQLINFTQLGNECGIDQKTVKSWLSILEASYIIFLLQPHFNNFRKRLTKSPKLYFYDVGLASYLLGCKRAEDIGVHPLKGMLFENFIVTEFLKNRWNNVTDSNLYFFRDHVGNEVDLVLDYGIELASVEIKMSQTIAPDFFKGLAYYNKLSKAENKKRFLVYGGSEIQLRESANVYPYSEMGKLFQQLPD